MPDERLARMSITPAVSKDLAGSFKEATTPGSVC